MKAKVKIARVVFNPYRRILTEEVRGKVICVRTGLYAHYCYEYDDMLIDESDPEFKNCLCGIPNAKT